MSSPSYPYPRIEHKRYKLTFLDSVKLVVVYDGNKDCYTDFRAFFQSFFKIDITRRQYDIKKADALRLRSSESGERYKFSRNVAEIVIEGDSYIDFQTSLSPFVYAFQKYLKSISAGISNLKINKTNAWPTPEAIGMTQTEIANVIFSKELLSESESNKGLSIKEIKLSGLDMSLIIKYGIITKEKYNIVVLDSVCDLPEEILADTMAQTLLGMNQVMYDAYHWAVNDDVIKVMDK